MATTALLLVFVGIATYTDVREGKIFNKTTYPGILTALAISALATLLGVEIGHETDLSGIQENGTELWGRRLGALHIVNSVSGFLLCGGMMTVCYVFFAGSVGGGDIKLLAMIGAFYGMYSGLEVLLWTFIIAGCLSLLLLIWKFGVLNLMYRVATYFYYLIRFRLRPTIRDEERTVLKTKLYLAPSALAAVLLVAWQLFRGGV